MIPDSYAGWARRAADRAAGLIARRRGPGGSAAPSFDAILSSSPPDSVHVAARGLARRFALPWVADFRDPWINLHLRPPRTRWHRERQARLERQVLEDADLVLAASATHAAMLDGRSARGEPPIRRVVLLPNGYEPETSALDKSAGTIEAPPDERATFELVYTGVLSLMPDVEVFLEALHELLARRPEARRRIRARLVGPFDSDYADRAQALGLTGIVSFLGIRPHAESLVLQRAAEVLLIWKPRGCPSMVPGKVYEYLDAGRFLLGVLDPEDEVTAMVRGSGGTVVPPGDRLALAAEIERLYDAWRAGTPARVGRPAWLAEHTRARLAARLAVLLDETVRTASR
jgi:glycosyltransferase involved in cell wall biosynthesis